MERVVLPSGDQWSHEQSQKSLSSWRWPASTVNGLNDLPGRSVSSGRIGAYGVGSNRV